MVSRASFQDSLHGVLSWFLDDRSTTIDQEGEHRPAAIARHLACCYGELGFPEPAGSPVLTRGHPLDVRAYLSQDAAYRQRVIDLCECVQDRMSGFITHFFLHGSLATLDYAKGWSDVDTFMVVKQETVTQETRLLALRRTCLDAWALFLRVTPLQHHGFIVVTEADLRSYPSHYLPLPALDTALAVLPHQPPLQCSLRSADTGSLRSLTERRDALRAAVEDGTFRHHPRQGVFLQAHYHNADNAMGQLHALLGYLMGVPAFLMDALGWPCAKRDAFAQARPYLSDEAGRIIGRASEIRRMWPLKEHDAFAGNAIPRWVQDLLGPNYLDDAFRLLDEAVMIAQRHPIEQAIH
jgi:hypothetical protein